MQKFTREMFDALARDEWGVKHCPTGDYTAIKFFGEGCSFGERCRFGESCSFGDWCSFGKSCSFGDWCSFGKSCSFGESCSFGKSCSFGDWCRFGERCRFGEGCHLGKSCSFGERCRLGKRCHIVEHEMLDPFVRSVSACGEEKRTLYVWRTKDGWFCQAGCFFGTEKDFRTAVIVKYGKGHFYLSALNLLKKA